MNCWWWEDGLLLSHRGPAKVEQLERHSPSFLTVPAPCRRTASQPVHPLHSLDTPRHTTGKQIGRVTHFNEIQAATTSQGRARPPGRPTGERTIRGAPGRHGYRTTSTAPALLVALRLLLTPSSLPAQASPPLSGLARARAARRTTKAAATSLHWLPLQPSAGPPSSPPQRCAQGVGSSTPATAAPPPPGWPLLAGAHGREASQSGVAQMP